MGECGHCTLPQMYNLDLNEAVCITSIFRSLQPNVQYLLFWEGVFGPLWGCNEKKKQQHFPWKHGKLLENRTNSQPGKTNISLRPEGRWVSSFRWDITVLQPFCEGHIISFPLLYHIRLPQCSHRKNLRFHSGFVMNIHGLMDSSQIYRYPIAYPPGN